ncbi:MAG TPA: acetyl-CoA hydrolase/transferase C-terminal domain-containing protein [Solirubrobacterales bacterium]|nr:acetyl-CoA hydrolase/transferase C-terminal domain-containing protein [Solirubrobacterales bacterium]
MGADSQTWQERVGSRHREIDDVIAMIAGGDHVVLSVREPFGLGLGLAAGLGELHDVHVYTLAPSYDFGWYDEGWEEHVDLMIGYPTAIAREALDAGRLDVYPGAVVPSLAPLPYTTGETPADFYFVEVSPPDEHGFCSFGVALWDKRRMARHSKVVVAEVNENLIRTYGENYIHESEIDFFVDHVPTGRTPGQVGTLAGRPVREPPAYLRDIAGYVGEYVEDGSTVQIGVGRTTERLVQMGMLEGKRDIGFHSELTVPGVITAAREGIINGARKNQYPGKLVATSVGGGSFEEIRWAHQNPLFELLEAHRLMDIRTIAAEDRFVAINNVLSVDLTGQIAAESIGPTLVGQAGGQLVFVVASWHSRGGHSLQVLPSTARDGTVSRIVPTHPPGTVITTPRNVVDKVVTEYGVAELKGRTLRQRAKALIEIAHPDHRDELRRQAGL